MFFSATAVKQTPLSFLQASSMNARDHVRVFSEQTATCQLVLNKDHLVRTLTELTHKYINRTHLLAPFPSEQLTLYSVKIQRMYTSEGEIILD